MSGPDRTVVLIDMDCFYCQVEEKLNPDLKGKPIAVVQYNEWQGGGIVAVNYVARARGVTRFMRGDDAKAVCPEIQLPSVPCVRGRGDLSKYRSAGKEVALVLKEFTTLLERASVDEAYLDITERVSERMGQTITPADLPGTCVLGYENVGSFIDHCKCDDDPDDIFNNDSKQDSNRLLIAAAIVEEIRAAVLKKTGYTCSAGIAHNKIMAKLICGMNKPNKQTVLPKSSIAELFESLPVGKVRSLGGKFGEEVCKKLKISKMKDLLQYSEKHLQKLFDEKNGSKLYNIARGKDDDPVKPHFNPKSIGCCKKFPGKNAIADLSTLTKWLKELGSEIEDRLRIDLDENNRFPTQMVVSFTKPVGGKDMTNSRSVKMSKEDILCGDTLASHALTIIRKDSKPFCSTEVVKIKGTDEVKTMLTNSITFLGISVGKFEENNEAKPDQNIQHFLNQMKASTSNDHKNVPQIENESTNAESNTNQSTISQINPNITNNECPVQKIVNKNHSKNQESNQESFIMKYLQTYQKPKSSEPSQPSIPINPADVVNIDESSKDSEASIELEINTSKALECDVDENARLEIEKLRTSFSIPVLKNEEIETFEQSETSEESFLCDKCHKNIPTTELQMHQDYHLAQSLREEERKESTIVKQNKPKQKITKPVAKTKNIGNKFGNIVTLFNKIKDDYTPSDDANYTVCSECKKTVEIAKIQEHTDHHEAVRLQKEINASMLPEISAKRKRSPDGIAQNVKHNPSNVRKIDSYFQ